jgi:adenylate cyclase
MPRKSLARRLSRRDSLAILLVGIGISVLVAVLGAWKASPIVRTDNLLVDAYLRASATGEQAQRTVVVDIDDVSLSAVGQWPWPRYRVAALIQRIAAEQPAAIALDILFPEPDRSSLVSIQQTFKRDFDLYITFSGVPAGCWTTMASWARRSDARAWWRRTISTSITSARSTLRRSPA